MPRDKNRVDVFQIMRLIQKVATEPYYQPYALNKPWASVKDGHVSFQVGEWEEVVIKKSDGNFDHVASVTDPDGRKGDVSDWLKRGFGHPERAAAVAKDLQVAINAFADAPMHWDR